MDAADRIRTGKICNRPRHAQHAGIASCGEAHGLGRLRQQLAPRIVRRGMGIEQVSIEFGIAARARSLQSGELQGPCPRNPRGDLIRAFGGRREGKVGSRYGIHLDMEVDPIKQGPRDLGLVIRRTARRPTAAERGIAEMTTPARVHRRNELHPRREGNVRIGAGHSHFTGFQRLAQRIEHDTLEFGQFIEEQDAEMCQADLSRSDFQPAACQRRHRSRVMGSGRGARG